MCSTFRLFSASELYQKLRANIKLVKSLVSRCFYALYIVFAVWRVTESYENQFYWCLLFTLLPLVVEAMYMAYVRGGDEYKWISPNVIAYMMGAVPCIWLWEIKSFHLNSGSTTNATECAELVSMRLCLSHDDWSGALEQVILFILILGKWVAPKGQMSRDELSQLLLVYLGAGGDISDMLDLTREDDIREKPNFAVTIIILIVWTWSLLQFTFVTTAVKELPRNDFSVTEIGTSETKTNVPDGTDESANSAVASKPRDDDVLSSQINTSVKQNSAAASSSGKVSVYCLPCYHGSSFFFLHNEIWGMALGLLFQDVPFFVVRLVLMIKFEFVSPTTVFFAFKNAVVVVLLLNRIRNVVVSEKRGWYRSVREAGRGEKQPKSGGGLHIEVERRRKPRWLIWRS